MAKKKNVFLHQAADYADVFENLPEFEKIRISRKSRDGRNKGTHPSERISRRSFRQLNTT